MNWWIDEQKDTLMMDGGMKNVGREEWMDTRMDEWVDG